MRLTLARERPDVWLKVWKGLRIRPNSVGVAMIFIERIESKRRKQRKELQRATALFENALTRLAMAGSEDVNLKQIENFAQQAAAARIQLAQLDFELRQAHEDLKALAAHHESELAQITR